MDPPLIAFYSMSSSRSFAQVQTAAAFCVNVLASDQEPFCRRFATAGDSKFDGVAWRPGPLGSPILLCSASWIECTFEDVREAGDHYIVLGRVCDLAVERSTLPLLFFQGGYGKFSPGSFIAAPDPELIQSCHVAETMRIQVEALSVVVGVNCSVLARFAETRCKSCPRKLCADRDPSRSVIANRSSRHSVRSSWRTLQTPILTNGWGAHRT